jgi:hypothetical protein
LRKCENRNQMSRQLNNTAVFYSGGDTEEMRSSAAKLKKHALWWGMPWNGKEGVCMEIKRRYVLC